jgi:hypothetical protein
LHSTPAFLHLHHLLLHSPEQLQCTCPCLLTIEFSGLPVHMLMTLKNFQLASVLSKSENTGVLLDSWMKSCWAKQFANTPVLHASWYLLWTFSMTTQGSPLGHTFVWSTLPMGT